MKDFHVTLKVRNGRMIKRMRELGIESAMELSRRSGVAPSRVGELLTFKRGPLFKNDWSQTALAISAALRIDPETLWPEHLVKLTARRGEVGFYADVDELKALPSNEAFVDKIAFTNLLSHLDTRQRDVIIRRFGIGGRPIQTLEDIGELYGIKKEQVRQIEDKAIRKLRHPKLRRLVHGVIA